MKTVVSKVVGIFRDDIDTDLIIPAEYLKVTKKDGLGERLFAELREAESDFPLNLVENEGREILVCGRNFGCGSSREHAAWAISDYGFKVVIAVSFADIFLGNAMKNQILPVNLERGVVERISDFDGEVEVDLFSQKVRFAEEEYDFSIDSYRKDCLINEMSDMDYLVSRLKTIRDFDRGRKMFFNINDL